MPHDFKGAPLKTGDVVSMLFTISNLSQNEEDCNVLLQAIDIYGTKNKYLPTVACNSKLTKLEKEGEDHAS